MGVWPLRIILLVVAAGITDAILLLFAGFLVWHWGSVLTAGYGCLIALFALVNLRVLHRALDNRSVASGMISRVRAHGLSIALPVAYLLGSLDSGLYLQQSWPQVLAMTVPSLVNWQAIEQTLHFHRRRSFT
jgi:hypothetical protein